MAQHQAALESPNQNIRSLGLRNQEPQKLPEASEEARVLERDVAMDHPCKLQTGLGHMENLDLLSKKPYTSTPHP